MSIDMFARIYKESVHGKKLSEELSVPFDKSNSHKAAISFSVYSLPKWTLFRACMSREFLLMKRNAFVYVFKSAQVSQTIFQLFLNSSIRTISICTFCLLEFLMFSSIIDLQLVFIATVTMTVFLRTQMHVDLVHANDYLGALFYSLIVLLIDGIPELSMTAARLPVFYKQRDLHFFPAWAYAIPATILKIPMSVLVAVVWTSLTYYVIGYTPEAGRLVADLMLII